MRMSARIRLGFVLALTTLTTPRAYVAQSSTHNAVNVTFSICDAKDESESWIQRGDCATDERHVIEWPLFSFPRAVVGPESNEPKASKGLNPKAMRVLECLLSPATPCGLEEMPAYWWIGPVR